MRQAASPLVYLVARQVLDNATTDGAAADAKPVCGGGGLDTSQEYNMGLHIGALFVILLTSTCGKI
jgi:hypothetical protein